MIGEVLEKRIKEFKDTTYKTGDNPFHLKLRDVAIEEIFNAYPSEIRSSEIISIYRRIFNEHLDCIPERYLQINESRHEASFETAIRNAFSTNTDPHSHKAAICNQPQILARTEPNRTGNSTIYMANPAYFGFFGTDAGADISTRDDGVAIISTPGDKLIELIHDYVDDLEVQKARAFNEQQVAIADNRVPEFNNSNGQTNRAKTKPGIAKYVIKKANYHCSDSAVSSHGHSTFSTNTNKNYLEAHHLVPMKFQKAECPNLDRSQNIVALCPTCHRAIHYGNYSVKKEHLLPIYLERKPILEELGIDMCSDIDEFIRKYYL